VRAGQLNNAAILPINLRRLIKLNHKMVKMHKNARDKVGDSNINLEHNPVVLQTQPAIFISKASLV